MGMQNSDFIMQELSAIRDRYAAQLQERIGAMRHSWSEYTASRELAHIKELHFISHGLSGSGATFGFQSITRIARFLEGMFRSVLVGRRELTPDDVVAIEEAFRRLDDASVQPDSCRIIDRAAIDAYRKTARENKIIFLVSHDIYTSTGMLQHLESYGYTVMNFDNLQFFQDSVKKTKPDAIVIDVSFPKGKLAGIETIQAMRPGVPVVFLSEIDDFDIRLRAVRAGGNMFFTQPVDYVDLAEGVEQLIESNDTQDYRVLIVEDDAILAQYYALSLEMAGMKAHVLARTSQLLDVMREFNPDIVLMDMLLPEVRGVDLAQVIRQVDLYRGIPILFLTGESSLEAEILALKSGGDDFIHKPVMEKQLIDFVAVRAERFRAVRRHLVMDQLTEAINSLTFKRMLSKEVARAKRYGKNMVLAVMDIDGLKDVNEKFGSVAGDRIILSLARIISLRIRRTDYIGRLDGDTFGVILVDVDLDLSRKVIDDIRQYFSELCHNSNGTTFSMTLCAGVVEASSMYDGKTLMDAATAALARAKKMGRNQITAQ